MARKKLLFRLLDAVTAHAQVCSAVLLASAAVAFAILPLLAREHRTVEAALLAGVADTRCVQRKLAVSNTGPLLSPAATVCSAFAPGALDVNRSASGTATASSLLQAAGLVEHTMRLTDHSKRGTKCQVSYAVLRPALSDLPEALVLVTPFLGT